MKLQLLSKIWLVFTSAAIAGVVVVYDMDNVEPNMCAQSMDIYSHLLLHTWDQSEKLHIYKDSKREETDWHEVFRANVVSNYLQGGLKKVRWELNFQQVLIYSIFYVTTQHWKLLEIWALVFVCLFTTVVEALNEGG